MKMPTTSGSPKPSPKPTYPTARKVAGKAKVSKSFTTPRVKPDPASKNR